MGAVKYDHRPLLAPGRHRLSMPEIEALCVLPFDGNSRTCRGRLFYALDDFIQRLLQEKIPCDIFVDGSFFTEKPEPDDVDVLVCVGEDVINALSAAQFAFYNSITSGIVSGVDSLAVTSYPRDHPYWGFAVDGGNAGDIYGIEHGQTWLKGYAVLSLWETDVGNRICR